MFRKAMRFPGLMMPVLIIAFLGLLSGCGTGGLADAPAGSSTGGTTGGGTTGGTTTPPPAAAIGLGTDTVAVKSDDTNKATVTATVLDASSAVIEGITVAFSASCDPLSTTCGTLSASSVKTNADGKASITFSSGTIDQSNRVITITATASGKSAQIPIQVVGSTLTMTPSATFNIPSDGSVTSTLTVTAKNAGGIPVYNVPVTLSVSGTGNVTLLPTTGKTDQSGNLMVTVTGALAGTATVKAEGLGAVATYNYTVIGPAVGTFGITSPTVDPASSSTASTLTVEVTVPDATVPNVTFATTLGSWDGPAKAIVTKAVDPGTKKVSAVLQSSMAGFATVQVYDSAAPSTTDSIGVAFYAPATSAAQISLQSGVSVLGLSTGGLSKTTTLRATVRTSLGTGSQPVGNAPVAFSIPIQTGGGESISPVVVYTDSTGLATATFTSGSASSKAGGVTINASVVGTVPAVAAPPIAIVIGGIAGSVFISPGSKITVLNTTTYALPMSVIVADSDGTPVPGATVSLGLWPVQYSSGAWYNSIVYDPNNPAKVIYKPYVTGTFDNEDVNENLIRDPGEDVNGDGFLTPPNSAAGTVPATVTTNDKGVANFDLVYLKGSAVWIRARVRASLLALGTETASSITFNLPPEKVEAEAGDLPGSSYPIGLAVAATAGSTVSYLLPAWISPYVTAPAAETYSKSSPYSAITLSPGKAISPVYTFTAPAGVTAGTVYYDSITASDGGATGATAAVRIVAR